MLAVGGRRAESCDLPASQHVGAGGLHHPPPDADQPAHPGQHPYLSQSVQGAPCRARAASGVPADRVMAGGCTPRSCPGVVAGRGRFFLGIREHDGGPRRQRDPAHGRVAQSADGSCFGTPRLCGPSRGRRELGPHGADGDLTCRQPVPHDVRQGTPPRCSGRGSWGRPSGRRGRTSYLTGGVRRMNQPKSLAGSGYPSYVGIRVAGRDRA